MLENNILCSRPLASQPYYIEKLHINLYSTEELCCFLSMNLPMAEDMLSDPELFSWLAEECKDAELASMLKDAARSGMPVEERLMHLFKDCRYFSFRELDAISGRVSAFAAQHPTERKKAYGDMLMNHGKLAGAIRIYEEILSMPGIASREAEFSASVLHNTGAAYAGLFKTLIARECFEKAFERCQTEKYLASCLKAAYIDAGQKGLEAEAAKLGANEKLVSAVLDMIPEKEPDGGERDPLADLEKWKADYHSSVDK